MLQLPCLADAWFFFSCRNHAVDNRFLWRLAGLHVSIVWDLGPSVVPFLLAAHEQNRKEPDVRSAWRGTVRAPISSSFPSPLSFLLDTSVYSIPDDVAVSKTKPLLLWVWSTDNKNKEFWPTMGSGPWSSAGFQMSPLCIVFCPTYSRSLLCGVRLSHLNIL